MDSYYYYLLTDDANICGDMCADRFSTQNELDAKIKKKFVGMDAKYRHSQLPLYKFGDNLIPDQLYCTFKWLNTFPDNEGCCHFHVLKSNKPFAQSHLGLDL